MQRSFPFTVNYGTERLLQTCAHMRVHQTNSKSTCDTGTQTWPERSPGTEPSEISESESSTTESSSSKRTGLRGLGSSRFRV